ncbi:selenium metabolism-associated LysR family transcriptional regulator [Desulfallas thermosapovorans]|uniref:DNA-binding transcriptional LysR family regulator n=1 Tax=Desulfallas thermosapovorans DSM 6562 TaxID=1121431 RepID=A0A5S4ZY12_9FIRM|nr:selenium metabolism-associated LysR family transcriptional regulator [Desulfallas thermosapovorans]TYO97798.1 DNA-binding transcriptional LysR family regulator [Desulfallas thermosapovorans DSM 6562]
MNFKQLEAFVRVAELQSFTRAARQMFMSQPAVSFQIKALEEDLSITLFQRSERKVTLTEAGRLLYPEAKQMLGHYDKIRAGLDALRGLKSGHLLIGASTIPGEYLLPGIIGSFRSKYPGVRVSLRIAGSGDVVRMVQERDIDLGVVGAAGQQDNVHFEKWLDDELVLIVPPHHHWSGKSVDISRLAGENLILREEGSGTRKSIFDILAKQGLCLDKLKTEIELGSTRSVISAVQAGMGIAFVSRWAATDVIEAGKVGEARLKGVNMTRSFYLAQFHPGITNYAADTFIAMLKEYSGT